MFKFRVWGLKLLPFETVVCGIMDSGFNWVLDSGNK